MPGGLGKNALRSVEEPAFFYRLRRRKHLFAMAQTIVRVSPNSTVFSGQRVAKKRHTDGTVVLFLYTDLSTTALETVVATKGAF